MVDERPGRKRRRGPRSLHAVTRRQKCVGKNSYSRPSLGSCSCKSEPKLLPMDVHIHILHVNLRGFLSHKTELEARIAKQGLPELVGITETHLDKSVPAITLSNYTLISRLDRRDGRQGGGIAFLALASVAPTVVHIGDSVDHERSWHILHSNMGPVLLALWYRPPSYQEDLAIVDLEME